MRTVSVEQVAARIISENPWWATARVDQEHQAYRPRAYFELFLPLVRETSLRRAVILMGPRRVGKTVLIHHAIAALIESGVDPQRICYFSVDHPLYNGLRLEQLFDHYQEINELGGTREPTYVFFDEIQYLKDWELHLKVLVDDYPFVKFVASGSAAAALRLKSSESGAGRFTDFLLPPLTFFEYLDLLGETDNVDFEAIGPNTRFPVVHNISELNNHFVNYINFGGYPEVLFSEVIQGDPGRFIKSDIIDKVLLRDLPGLYGIRDIQELNYLFTTLAFNSANEVSLEGLSQNSGVAKNTIKRYIEYLEAAFLIKVVHRVDRSAKRFKRANFFKVYLTNPSMRAALFAPIGADDEAMGDLAETAIYSQWFHAELDLLYYARWSNGEVDIVALEETQRALWAVEVKWTDRYVKQPGELRSLLDFCERQRLSTAIVTTRTQSRDVKIGDLDLRFLPASLYCLGVGHNIVRSAKEKREYPGFVRPGVYHRGVTHLADA